jgi:hypothetical protein
MIILIISAIISEYIPKSIRIKMIKKIIFNIEAIIVINKMILVLLIACIKEEKIASR